MNRENFDMDGSLDIEDNTSNKNNKKSKSARIMSFILILLIIVSAIAGYYYIKELKTDNTNINNPKTKQTSIETIENTINEEQLQPTTEISSTNISDTKVNLGIENIDDDTIALDISKVKSDKAKEGAVQFVEHIVQSNEDLNSIAKLYGLKVQTLISINEIKNISGVTEGVILSIPDRNGRFYVVQSGDMLSTIANKYCPNLGWKTLQEINGLTDTRLDVGDKIFIPDMSEINANPAINTSLNKFIKPSNGIIIAKYGQFMEDNIYNDDISLDGILIRTNSIIVASAKGSVVDILNKNGKKNIKIAHDGGYVTIYGNLEATQLSIGDDVDINTEIGTVFPSDNILYFAIIQGGIPLDPESFF